MPRISESIGLHCGSAWSELLECSDREIGDRRGTVWIVVGVGGVGGPNIGDMAGI